VVLYLLNLRLRWTGNQSLAPLALSLIAVIGIGISGWLGGKMVYEQRVGVDERAGLGTGAPADEQPTQLQHGHRT
jgi:uncharacterized membrane protein